MHKSTVKREVPYFRSSTTALLCRHGQRANLSLSGIDFSFVANNDGSMLLKMCIRYISEWSEGKKRGAEPQVCGKSTSSAEALGLLLQICVCHASLALL